MFSDAEGKVNENMPEARVTMEFVDLDGKTKLINRTRYATKEALKSVLDMGVLQGVTQTWDQLVRFLEEFQKDP